MLRVGPKAKVFLSLLCVLVVALRVSGAHLHLCFDGSEPPASVHFDGDGGVHHVSEESHDVNAGHSDLDVNLVIDALVKLGSGDLDLLGLLAALSLLIFFLPIGSEPRTKIRSVIFAFVSRSFLRPPLRGPPRYA